MARHGIFHGIKGGILSKLLICMDKFHSTMIEWE